MKFKVGDYFICTCSNSRCSAKIPTKITFIEKAYSYMRIYYNESMDNILSNTAVKVNHYNTKLGKILYK